jgi:putative peptide zinc metalloprotease protein
MTAAVKENDPLLPPLRPDLELFPGPSEADGSPTYSLYDPLSGVYHKIGWAEAAVLRHLRAPRLLSDVLATVRKSLTVELSREDILGLCQDAARNGLTVSSCVRDVPDLMRERAMRKMHPLKWVAQHYLYFRLPLIYPARFLARALPCARLLASRPMLALYLALSVMGVLFLAEKPERYLATFPHFLSVEGAAWYGIAVAGIKIGRASCRERV